MKGRVGTQWLWLHLLYIALLLAAVLYLPLNWTVLSSKQMGPFKMQIRSWHSMTPLGDHPSLASIF